MKKNILIFSLVALLALAVIPMVSAIQGVTWAAPSLNSSTLRGTTTLNVTTSESADEVTFSFREGGGLWTVIGNNATGGNKTTFIMTWITTQSHDNGTAYQLRANVSNFTASKSANLTSITLDNTNVSITDLSPADNVQQTSKGFTLSGTVQNATSCTVSVSRGGSTELYDSKTGTLSGDVCSFIFPDSEPADGATQWFVSGTDGTRELSSSIISFDMDTSGGFSVQGALAAQKASEAKKAQEAGGVATGPMGLSWLVWGIIAVAAVALFGGFGGKKR